MVDWFFWLQSCEMSSREAQSPGLFRSSEDVETKVMEFSAAQEASIRLSQDVLAINQPQIGFWAASVHPSLFFLSKIIGGIIISSPPFVSWLNPRKLRRRWGEEKEEKLLFSPISSLPEKKPAYNKAFLFFLEQKEELASCNSIWEARHAHGRECRTWGNSMPRKKYLGTFFVILLDMAPNICE